MSYLLKVRLPADRNKAGDVQFVDTVTGLTAFGPVPCLGLASRSLATDKGNPKRDTTKGFGNTPTGSFDVVSTLPLPQDKKLRDSFGPLPRLRIIGKSGDAMIREAWAKDTLRIHGGRDSDQQNKHLRPTAGCLRVFNADMKSILDFIEDHGIAYPFELVVQEAEGLAPLHAAEDAGASEDPDTEAAHVSLRANPLATRRLLHSTISLGQANPVQQLLLRQAMLALREIAPADKAKLTKLQNDLAELSKTLRGATNLRVLQEVLLTPLAREYRVDQAFQSEMLSKRLIPTLSGVIEGHSVRPLWQSLGQQLGTELAQRLAGNDAERVYTTVGAVLGWTDAMPDAAALASVVQRFPNGASALEAFWNTGELPSYEAVEDLATQLALDAAVDLAPALQQAQKAFAYPSTLSAIAKDFAPGARSVAQFAGSMKAGASALSGVLEMIGAKSEAAIVQKASGYLQSAAQVQQCAALLMAGATGWGAALAVSGLVGGTAGLGVFGGPGGGGDAAQAMQATVLGAIEKLQQSMLREFSKVNERLADITRLLEDVLREIRKTNLMLGRVLDKVDEVDRKLDLLLLRVDRGVVRLLEELHKAEDIRCMAEAYEAEISKSRLYTCILFYARVASRPELFPSHDAEFPDLIARLEAAFSSTNAAGIQTAGAEEATKDMWASVGILSRALSEIGIAVPGRPANAPMLTAAVQNLAELHDLVGPMFCELRDQHGLRERIRDVRATILEHELFIRYLRGETIDPEGRQRRWIRTHAMRNVAGEQVPAGRAGIPVISRLMELLRQDLEQFSAGCKTLRQAATRQIVTDMSQGRTSFPELSTGATLRNAIDNGSQFAVIDASDAAAYPSIKLLLSCIDPASDADRLRIVLQRFQITNRDDNAQRLKVAFYGDVFLYGKKVMPSWSTELELLYDYYHKWQAAIAHIGDGVKLLEYSDNKNGPSNSYQLGDMIIAQLVAQGQNDDSQAENIWTVQRARVVEINQHLQLRVAQLLAGSEQDWGDAAAGLAALSRANDKKVMLMAVLRTAFEDAYNACDALTIAFEGGIGYRLFDPERLKVWANAVLELSKSGAAPDPANHMHALAGTYPDNAALGRFNAFEKIVDAFIDSARGAGRSFGLERAVTRFRRLETY